MKRLSEEFELREKSGMNFRRIHRQSLVDLKVPFTLYIRHGTWKDARNLGVACVHQATQKERKAIFHELKLGVFFLLFPALRKNP
jgi:hypothetical protein